MLFCAGCGGLGNGKSPQMIQILLEIDSNGKAVPILIDSKNINTPLTLGTFVNAVAEAAMMGGATEIPNPIDLRTIGMIKVKKEYSGVKTYFVGVKTQYDPTGREEPLNLGCLLSGAAVAYPGCTADQINGQSVAIKLKFMKDAKGKIQSYYEGDDGTEDFTLGVLLKASTTLLNQCERAY